MNQVRTFGSVVAELIKRVRFKTKDYRHPQIETSTRFMDSRSDGNKAGNESTPANLELKAHSRLLASRTDTSARGAVAVLEQLVDKVAALLNRSLQILRDKM